MATAVQLTVAQAAPAVLLETLTAAQAATEAKVVLAATLATS